MAPPISQVYSSCAMAQQNGSMSRQNTIEYKSLFEGKGDYSLAIDKNHYIWIAWNDGSVWRGRLNKLGFKQQ